MPSNIERHYRSLKNDQTIIEGIDFGKGRVTAKTVGHYSETSAIPDFQADLIYRLTKFLKPSSILELGTNLGKSTRVMRAGAETAAIVSVEGNKALYEYSKDELEKELIETQHMSFDQFFKLEDGRSYDFVFLDGDHRLEPTIKYFEELKSRMNPGGVVILHDIYWSKGMKKAWQTIVKDPDVQVTVDLFFMGLIWFDLPQARQHFSIKFPEKLLQLL